MSAFDLDGSSPNNYVVYRIQSGASDKFIIESETGTISVAKGATLDPDLTIPKKISYSLIVVALDGAPGSKQLQTSINVDIAIIDINNKPPIFMDPGRVYILENSPVSKSCLIFTYIVCIYCTKINNYVGSTTFLKNRI